MLLDVRVLVHSLRNHRLLSNVALLDELVGAVGRVMSLLVASEAGNSVHCILVLVHNPSQLLFLQLLLLTVG